MPDDDDSKKKDKAAKYRAMAESGRDAREQGQRMVDSAEQQDSSRSDVPSPNTDRTVQSYRKGGKVRKTGPALLHRGEIVKKKRGRGRRKRMSGRD